MLDKPAEKTYTVVIGDAEYYDLTAVYHNDDNSDQLISGHNGAVYSVFRDEKGKLIIFTGTYVIEER